MNPEAFPTSAAPAEPLRRPRTFGRTSLWAALVTFLCFNVVVATWRPKTGDENREADLLARLPSGHVPRFDYSTGIDLVKYMGFIPDARKQPLTYVVGMSQMYTINDPRPGDEIVAELLDDAVAPQARVFGLAAPNLDNEEAVFLVLATLIEDRTRPANVIFGSCFDKMRNIDIRPTMLRFLSQHAKLQSSIADVVGRYRSRYPLACEKLASSLHTAQAPVEDRSIEARLRGVAARVLPIAGARTEIDWTIQMRLYALRNAILHIRPTDKRPMLKSRYDLNMEFLGLLSDIAADIGIRLIVYVSPLNPQAENPYVESEYSAFKVALERLAQDHRLPFADLEDVVPAGDWGEFAGGPDFKHFRGEGHRLTARALLARFGPLLQQGGTAR